MMRGVILTRGRLRAARAAKNRIRIKYNLFKLKLKNCGH